MATKKNAAKKSAKKAPAKKTTRAAGVERNGITQPNEGSDSRRIWDIADSLSTKSAPAVRADVIAAAAKKGINEATVATQYQRWRTFHGIETRSPGSGRKPAAKKATAKKSASKPKAPAKAKAKGSSKKPAAKKASAPRKPRAAKAPAAPSAPTAPEAPTA